MLPVTEDTQQPTVQQRRDYYVVQSQMTLDENKHHLLLNYSTLFSLRRFGSQYTFPTKALRVARVFHERMSQLLCTKVFSSAVAG